MKAVPTCLFGAALLAVVRPATADIQVTPGSVIRPAWTLGSRLWLRWVVRNHQGFDHGLAIDNLKLTVERP